MWTFRFRIARYEHWWWTVVSVMLLMSFCLIVLSFLSGNNSDSLGVLTLSTAAAIAIVRYAIPAWRNRIYIELRWLSWTGSSRTGIAASLGKYCGTRTNWLALQNLNTQVYKVLPSDEWGWDITSNPTVVLQVPGLDDDSEQNENKSKISSYAGLGPCVYDDGYSSGQVSLLWGEKEGFRRRSSRAISSMPSGLLKSIPSTYDGFNGTGICLCMGILGRNKGLAPFQLVFDIFDRLKNQRGVVRLNQIQKISTELEATSAWSPRPNKGMRSFYQKMMDEQYSGLGVEYIAVAVELALICSIMIVPLM